VCKPTDNFASHECVKSCAAVSCASNEHCVDGACVEWCDPPCVGGQVCDPSTKTCVDNKCGINACEDGSCCDPLTGECGNCPCEGVLCPGTDRCQDGECVVGGGGTGGTGGSAGAGGTAGSAGSGATGGTGATGGSGGTGGKDGGATVDGSVGGSAQAEPDPRVWGLATGGGGCACRVGGEPGSTDTKKTLVLMGLAAALVWSRRRAGKLESGKGGAR